MNTRAIKNDRFLRALKKQPVCQTPIWIMRQAGRYLPEYHQVRQQAGGFINLCRSPELACRVTLQPLERFKLDAAIIFTDILVIPDAMGLGLRFEESIGPVFERPIMHVGDIGKIKVPDPEVELSYVLAAVRTTVKQLDSSVPLIGFAGSPWTLAVYMIEGRSKTDFSKIKSFADSNTKHLHQLLWLLTESICSYLTAKQEAGANALMIFDTWGSLLTTPQYHEFSLRYMARIVEHLSKTAVDVPVILFTRNSGKWLESMAATKCHAIGVDWTVNIGEARRRVGDFVAIQGNLHPETLKKSDEKIRSETANVLSSYGKGIGHIFNLGHGITPDIDPRKVSVLVDSVHELSRKYHR